MQIEILDRSRNYGYMFWMKSQDMEIKDLLGNIDRVSLVFDGNQIGEKNVDLKNRRISIGHNLTRRLSPKIKFFNVSLKKPSTLIVVCSA